MFWVSATFLVRDSGVGGSAVLSFGRIPRRPSLATQASDLDLDVVYHAWCSYGLYMGCNDLKVGWNPRGRRKGELGTSVNEAAIFVLVGEAGPRVVNPLIGGLLHYNELASSRRHSGFIGLHSIGGGTHSLATLAWLA